MRGPPVALHVSQQISSESWDFSGVAAVSRYTPPKKPCRACRSSTARGVWKAAYGVTKRIVRFLGGKTYHRARPPKPVLEASNSGICLVCAGFPLRKTTGRKQTGGGKRIIGGGVQNRFWEGVLWYVFPSPEFSTPLCFSLRCRTSSCL